MSKVALIATIFVLFTGSKFSFADTEKVSSKAKIYKSYQEVCEDCEYLNFTLKVPYWDIPNLLIGKKTIDSTKLQDVSCMEGEIAEEQKNIQQALKLSLGRSVYFDETAYASKILKSSPKSEVTECNNLEMAVLVFENNILDQIPGRKKARTSDLSVSFKYAGKYQAYSPSFRSSCISLFLPEKNEYNLLKNTLDIIDENNRDTTPVTAELKRGVELKHLKEIWVSNQHRKDLIKRFEKEKVYTLNGIYIEDFIKSPNQDEYKIKKDSNNGTIILQKDHHPKKRTKYGDD